MTTTQTIGTLVLGCVLASTSVAAQTAETTIPEVKVTRLAAGRVLVEVHDAGVSVRKEIGADASHVTITTAKDELQVRVARGQMTVSTPGGTVSLTDGRGEDLARLMAVLQRSDAAARGRDLLKRIPAGPRNFGQQALLLTRAVLELGTGPSQALATHRRWVAEERERLLTQSARPSVTRIGLQDLGPGDCWDLYSKEAIRIAEDFAECTDGLKWYDALGWGGCSLIYTVRAEGAMFWFISCNGGIPFKG